MAGMFARDPRSLMLGSGERMSGQEVRDGNVTAALSIANVVKSSLGPVGLDKMMVDDIGDVTISNDGATILNLLEVKHPAGRILVELAQQQDKEVGDGTTSVVIFAAELLKRANDLVKNRIHPTTVITGYRLAAKEAIKYLHDQLSVKVDTLGKDTLANVAKTSMSSKTIGSDDAFFATMAVDAMLAVKTINPRGEVKYPVKAVNILKSHGKSVTESMYVKGYALNCTVASQAMKKRVTGAKIACLDINLQKTRMNLGVHITIDDPEQLEAIRRREAEITLERVRKILASGANVVFTTKGIDDLCLKEFVEAGAMAVRRCKKEDLRRIAKATGATLVGSLANLEGEETFEASNLGTAEEVVQERISDDELILVKGTKVVGSTSIILRGANDYLLDEMERALHDSLCVIKRTLESGSVVPGGGAVETALSIYLENFATTLGSREQLAIAEFANALLVIPKTLAVNAAKDSTDLVAKLRAYHHKAQRVEKGAPERQLRHYGLDLLKGEVRDNVKSGVLEPTLSKVKSYKAALEACTALLRIDDSVVVPSASCPASSSTLLLTLSQRRREAGLILTTTRMSLQCHLYHSTLHLLGANGRKSRDARNEFEPLHWTSLASWTQSDVLAMAVASASVLSRLHRRAEVKARPRLLAWGRFVAGHQIAVLLGVAVAICLALGPPIAALIQVARQTGSSANIWDFFTRPHLRADGTGLRHIALYHNEPCWTRCQKQRVIVLNPLWLTSENHLAGTADEHGVLERSSLHAALKIQQSLTAQLESDPAAHCVRDVLGQCALISPLSAWNASETALLSDTNPLDTLTSMKGGYSAGGLAYLLPWTLVGSSAHHVRALSKADFIGIITFREASSTIDMSAVLDQALAEDSYKIGDMPHADYARIVIKTVPEEAGRVVLTTEALGYAAVYLVVGLYVWFRLRMLTRIHSRSGLVFTGLTELLLSGLMSLRICQQLGLRLDLVPWQFMPFLIVILGVDNIFVLSQAISATSVELTLPDRVAEGFAQVGFGLFLSLLAELGFFGTAFFLTPQGHSWKEISGFICVALTVDYALQLTFFLTVLSIDTQRLEMADLITQMSTIAPSLATRRRATSTKDEHLVTSSFVFLFKGALSALYARRARTFALTLLVLADLALRTVRNTMLNPDLCGPTSDRAILPPDWTDEERQFWHVMNPDDAPQLHIAISAPLVVALGGTRATRFTTVPNRLQVVKQPSFLTMTLLPTALIVTALYWLLVQLIKDREFVAAEKARAAVQRAEAAEAAREREAKPRALLEGITEVSELDLELMAVGSKTVISWTAFDPSLTVSRIAEWFDVPTGQLEPVARILLGTEAPLLAVSVTYDDTLSVAYSGKGDFHVYSLADKRHLESLAIEEAANSRLQALFPFPQRDTVARPRKDGEMDSSHSFVALFTDGSAYRVDALGQEVHKLLSASEGVNASRKVWLCARTKATVHEPRYVLRHEQSNSYSLHRIDDMGVSSCASIITPSPVVAVATCSMRFGDSDGLFVAVATKTGQVLLVDGSTGEELAVVHNNSDMRVKSIGLAACPAFACSRCGERQPHGAIVAFAHGSKLSVKYCYQGGKGCHCTPLARSPSLKSRELDELPTTPSKKSTDNGLSTIVPTHGAGRRGSHVFHRKEVEGDSMRTPPVTPGKLARTKSEEVLTGVSSVAELDVEPDAAWAFVGPFLAVIRRRRAGPSRTAADGVLSEWELTSLHLEDAHLPQSVMSDPLHERPADIAPPPSQARAQANMRRRKDPLAHAGRLPVVSGQQLPFSRARHLTTLANGRVLATLGNSIAVIDASASAWSQPSGSPSVRAVLRAGRKGQ